jgi:DNA-binding NtrC family response regulator
MALRTLVPDVKIILDSNCVIRQVTTANDVSDEGLDQWTGRPWADTVSGIEPAVLTELVLGARRESVSPIFQLVQNFPSGQKVPFDYLVFCRDNGRDFVVVGRDLRRIASQLSRYGSRHEATGDPLRMIEYLGRAGERLGETSLKEAVSSAVSLVERHYIEAALEAVGGNRTAAARILGISRQGFYDKLARYRIDEHAAKQ